MLAVEHMGYCFDRHTFYVYLLKQRDAQAMLIVSLSLLNNF